MTKLVNRAKMTTATTGTGTIALGSAVDGYQTFAAAGVANGNVVRYVIEDGDAWEIGSGTYTASGTTLSRTVSESSNGNAALNLTGDAIVFVTAAGQDIVQPGDNVSTLTNDAGYTTNTGTVTSVGVTAGTGITVSGSPITSSGSITVTNAAPDQVVSLTGGSNVTVTGTYPSFTVAASNTNLGYTSAASAGTVTSSTGNNATLPAATTSIAGLLTSADKTKLDGIAAGAQVNVATNLGNSVNATSVTVTSSTGTDTTLPAATTTNAGVFVATDKTKLDGIQAGAQVNVATNLTYSTAATTGTVNSSTGTNATIPAATTSVAGLMTNADKTKLNGVETGAQVNVATNLGYTTAASSGTVTSSTGTNATLPAATTSAAGLLTSADKTKLDGVATGATANTGTVTSVAATAGTGISISGSPITTSGTITVTNTAPHIATNLSYTAAASNGTVNSSTGTNATLPAATTSAAGLLTSADKTKLDGIAAGAQVNVATNLGYTGAATTGTVTSSTGTNATLPAATTSVAGLLTGADKTKLDGIQAGAQVNVGTNLGSSGTGGTRTITSSTGSDTSITYTASDVDAQAANAQLTALAGLATNGIIARTGTNTVAARTLTAGTNITITNGDGVSGNPTISATAAAPTTEQVGTATSGLSVGAVGSYAFLGEVNNATTNPGGTRAGSSLRYANVIRASQETTANQVNWSNTEIRTAVTRGGSGTPAGTWRAMGFNFCFSVTAEHFRGATLWLRIS